MAQDASYQGLKSQVFTSIFGRRFGLDSNDFSVGPKGLRAAIFTVTSASTGNTTLPNYGTILARTTDSSATTAGWNIDSPQPGCVVNILCQTTGYAVFTLNGSTQSASAVRGFVTGPYNATGLSSATLVTLWNQGSAAQLIGLTTAQWQINLVAGGSLSTFGSSAL